VPPHTFHLVSITQVNRSYLHSKEGATA